MNAQVNWTPTNGDNYEIWYAPLSTVGTTSIPPSTGWVQATGSPFDSTLGTATITGLNDNTKYRIDTRSDCTSTDSGWTDNVAYKLVCPGCTLTPLTVTSGQTGASIASQIIIENYLEFETIATSITLTATPQGSSTVAQTQVFTAPYSLGTLNYTFNNLLTGTTYVFALSIFDSIANATVSCGTQNSTTLTPTVVPPPTCTVPVFALSNITASSVVVNIMSSLSSGDTFDISINGGASFISTSNTATPITINGLTQSSTYQVVVRRNCGAGGTSMANSQTFTTLGQVIPGTITMDSSINATTAPALTFGTVFLKFTFPSATPAPITLYFGCACNLSCNTTICAAGTCTYVNGTNIFSPSSSICPQPFQGQTGLDLSGTGQYPFQVLIPQGVTSFTTNTNIRTIFPTTQNPWTNFSARNTLGGSGHVGKGYTDLYVHVQSPSGYSGSFTMVDGTNIKGVTLHNV